MAKETKTKLSGSLTLETFTKDLEIKPETVYEGLILVRKQIVEKKDNGKGYQLSVQGVGDITNLDSVNIIIALLQRSGINIPEPESKEELYILMKLFDALGEGAKEMFEEYKRHQEQHQKEDEKGGIPNA